MNSIPEPENLKTGRLFMFATGLSLFFVQLHLVSMIISDPRSLHLGSWDLQALVLFDVLLFVLIPVAVFLLLLGTQQFGAAVFRGVISAVIAYSLGREIDFFLWRELFIGAFWLRLVLLGLAFFSIFWLIRRYFRIIVKFVALISPLSLIVFIYFSMETSSAIARKEVFVPKSAAMTRALNPAPILILTFERIIYTHVFGENGQIDARVFPNFSRLVSKSDVFHQAYANGTHTWTGLNALYSGRDNRRAVTTKPSFFGGPKNLPAITDIMLAAGWKIFFVTDSMPYYCNKRKHICINALGDNTVMRRWRLIRAWFQEYLKIFIPSGALSEKLSLIPPWDTILWETFVSLESLELEKAEDRADALGKIELDVLIDLIRKEGKRRNVYLSHNLFHHNVAFETSGLIGRSDAEYRNDLKIARPRMRELDQLVGHLLDSLQDAGIWDSMLVLLTSDTGSDIGVGIVKGKKRIPDTPELAHIFMALKRPFQERRRDFWYPVNQVDMVPTLLTHIGKDPSKFDFDGKAATDPNEIRTLKENPIYIMLPMNTYRLLKVGGLWELVN